MVKGVSWLAALSCLPGGALWAVSPLGVVLAESRLQEGSDLFWKLFPAAPLALALGVVGLLWIGALGSGWPSRAGAGVTLLGLLMVVAGVVGQFWLGLDEAYTVLAPAYYTFRAGLVVLAGGSLVTGLAGMLRGSLPAWGALPFVAAALCGLVAFVWELGTIGSGLWAVFGAGWMWLGFSVAASGLAGSLRRRTRGASHPGKSGAEAG
ncbi:hypothetical protein [Rubrobacter aplysinae]|uniref:hypothetical protein n=1 Tax=Rubrobacter aplysinae TaxID=909625 RepID=UPI00064BC868|nr:hypothetical protein [Rubrobacter aplysinae]